MTPTDSPAIGDVEFDELERVDHYEATFTGTLDGEEITLTYALESAVGADESTTVYTPGDEKLEDVVVDPESYEFEADDRETVRFTATDADRGDLFLVYAFAEAEDGDENQVGLDVDAS